MTFVLAGPGAVLVLAAALLTADPEPAKAIGEVETVYLGGKVFTADPARPWVEAIATRGDRIAAVGSRKDIEALAVAGTRRVELRGRTVIPGLNDAHHHFGSRPQGSVELEVPLSAPWADLAAAVDAAAKKAPSGMWIIGDIAPRAWFEKGATRASLDSVSDDHPVALGTLCGHGRLVNSVALARLHIGTAPPDPPGGWYERSGKSRTTTGRLLEAACFDFKRRLAESIDLDTHLRTMRDMVAADLRLGWTSIQTMSWLPLSTAVAVAEKAGSPLRIRVIRFPVNTADARNIRGSASPPPPPGSLVTVNGLKWFLEGAPCEKTSALRHPYGDGTVARLPYRPEVVRAILQEGVKQGQPLLFHAGGARAIEELFTAMESMPDIEWTHRRVRIEHGDELSPEMFARARRLGIVLVQNPEHLGVLPGMDIAAVKRFLGVQPSDVTQPMRTVLEAGIPLALGTDGSENPFRNILLASTHPSNPGEALTREQAVTAFTRGAAYAEFAEKEKGTLAPGMLADFVVLSRDVFTAPADQVPDIRSVLTIIGGKVAFDATAADAGVQ